MKKAKEYAIITIGVVLVALGAEFFMVPNKIAAGGNMGMAIIINSLIPVIPVGAIMMMMDVILFTIAFIVIGSKFGAKTIYTSLSLSGLIWIFDKTSFAGKAVTNNLFLAATFGTFLSGIGMGIVFNQNASTGGTDIIAKIINKFFHLDIGKALLMVDFIITLFAGIAFGAEVGMFALLSVILNGFVIDKVIEGLNECKQVMVISNKYDQISNFIMENMERGCTIFHGKGGYSKNDTYILFTVLGRKEFIKLKKYIKEVDSAAFITVSDAREVLGEGFKDIIGED